MLGLPPNSLFSVFAFIGFLLAGTPLPWHMQSRNMGSGMFMLWTSFGCFILFVNSIVWNNNAINSAPVWCDISTHYLIGASVGIPASSFCIIRRLYYITKLRTISVDKAQRRREIIVDVSIGIGFPCVVMALQYIVQNRRFAIYEQIGCYPCIENTPLAYFLISMWPLVIGLISLVYAVLAFRMAFLQQERSKKILHAGFSINSRYYWRLMAVCTSEIIFTVPLSLYVIISNVVAGQPTPYVSWAVVHSDFSQIPQYPAVIWQSIPYATLGLESLRWTYILCAFVIFAFFGWAREVREFYTQMLWSVCRRLGFSKSPSPPLPSMVPKTKRGFTYAGKPTLPVHDADHQTRWKHLSIPIQARTKSNSAGTFLSFEALPGSESLFSSSQLSLDKESIEDLPRFPTLTVSTHHTHISSESMPAIPEPAFARDRPSFDVAQLA